MKKNKIVEVVSNHFKVIHHFILREYYISDKEKIKEFISTVKQLKSFFHLLDMQSARESCLNISRKMKLLYDYSEALYGLQFHLQNIISYCECLENEIPIWYINRVEDEINSWKNKTEHFIKVNRDFKDDQETIMAMLPQELSTASIKKFVDYNLFELKNLSECLYKDESLHTIKKLLEDFFYNWIFITTFLFQKDDFFNKKTIKLAVDILDDYYKKCEDVALLKMYGQGLKIEKEKETLDGITARIHEEMKLLKNNIDNNLQLMRLSLKTRKYSNMATSLN